MIFLIKNYTLLCIRRNKIVWWSWTQHVYERSFDVRTKTFEPVAVFKDIFTFNYRSFCCLFTVRPVIGCIDRDAIEALCSKLFIILHKQKICLKYVYKSSSIKLKHRNTVCKTNFFVFIANVAMELWKCHSQRKKNWINLQWHYHERTGTDLDVGAFSLNIVDLSCGA